MTRYAYYNENEAFAAEWLRNLMSAGLIMEGEVDERSIEEVEPSDVAGFERCHFFAGIAGWELALALAGWPDGARVWTGSCPCQPFSQAGKKLGENDERHLWPVWMDLIAECRPAVIFGEQVASSDGRDWLASVRADLEDVGYAVGAADLCAAGVGAPHIRQRLWFVADATSDRYEKPLRENREPLARGGGEGGVDSLRVSNDGGVANAEDANRRKSGGAHDRRRRSQKARSPGDVGWLADLERERCEESPQLDGSEESGVEERKSGRHVDGRGDDGGLGNTKVQGDRQEKVGGGAGEGAGERRKRLGGGSSSASEPWSDCEWIPCRDPKRGIVWRPTQPGTFPLASRLPGDVGKLRAYGNSIVPQVGAVFIRAWMETAGIT